MDKKEALENIGEDGYGFESLPDEFKKDKDVVLAAIKQGGSNLQYADDSLKKDKDIVLEAVKQEGYALEYAGESLKKDKEIVLEAVKQYANALEYADESLKQDKEIVLAAVKDYGAAFEYADESLKQDKEIILIAIKDYGAALEYADDSLKKDKEIVLIAVKQDGNALQYADDSLKKDKEIVREAVRRSNEAIQYIDESLKEYFLKYTLESSELNYSCLDVNLNEIDSTEKLNKYLSDFVKNSPDEGAGDSCLVLGGLKSEDEDQLESTYLTIDNSNGTVDDITINYKNTGKLITPKKGHAVLVFYYYYNHGIYYMQTYNKIKDFFFKTKHFNNEAVIIENSYPDFEFQCNEASGGGNYQFKIVFEDDQAFECDPNSKDEWIEEISEHLKNISVIK
tara:strand:+ start:692 stop:1879 length:1188 start_codon:yes stop_codon:yes gene_type:complete